MFFIKKKKIYCKAPFLKFFFFFFLRFIYFSKGVLGLVRLVLYVYGQLKLNISVCEILNWNRSKWLETVGFGGISISVDFGRVSVFQREGHWDFQNPNFNHIKEIKIQKAIKQ